MSIRSALVLPLVAAVLATSLNLCDLAGRPLAGSLASDGTSVAVRGADLPDDPEKIAFERDVPEPAR